MEIAFGTPLPPKDRADNDEIKTLIHYTAEKVSIFDVLDLFGIKYHGRHTQKIRCIFPINHIRGDQNPSARIHAQKNRYTCYSCGEGGDPVFVTKLLGGLRSVGEAIAFLDKELYLELGSDPELRRLIRQKEQPINPERERISRTRVLEEQILSRAVQLREGLPHDTYCTLYFPLIDYWWGEWDDARQSRDEDLLQQYSKEFLAHLQVLSNGIRREKFCEEAGLEELMLWG